jgi:hypothetical protein
VPGIQTILYENTGHVPQLEIPGQVAADIHQWITAQAVGKKSGPGGRISGMWIFISVGAVLFLLILLRPAWSNRRRKAVEKNSGK